MIALAPQRNVKILQPRVQHAPLIILEQLVQIHQDNAQLILVMYPVVVRHLVLVL